MVINDPCSFRSFSNQCFLFFLWSNSLFFKCYRLDLCRDAMGGDRAIMIGSAVTRTAVVMNLIENLPKFLNNI